MTDTAPTAEVLARLLDAEGLPALAVRARDNEFHDYKSHHVAPEHVLMAELANAGRHDLARRVIAGEFDASREEAQEWASSAEGLESIREMGPALARMLGLPPDHPVWQKIADTKGSS